MRCVKAGRCIGRRHFAFVCLFPLQLLGRATIRYARDGRKAFTASRTGRRGMDRRDMRVATNATWATLYTPDKDRPAAGVDTGQTFTAFQPSMSRRHMHHSHIVRHPRIQYLSNLKSTCPSTALAGPAVLHRTVVWFATTRYADFSPFPATVVATLRIRHSSSKCPLTLMSAHGSTQLSARQISYALHARQGTGSQ